MLPKIFEDYIASAPAASQSALREIYSVIKKRTPMATECIAYGMPCFKIGNIPVIYFAGFEHHIGIYATPDGHEHFKKEFAPYKGGKGSVQFPLNQPIPMGLIAAVTDYRVEKALGS